MSRNWTCRLRGTSPRTWYVGTPEGYSGGERSLDCGERDETDDAAAGRVVRVDDPDVVEMRANRWAIEHLLYGKPLAEVIEEPFAWQPGWEYVLDERAVTIL